MAKEEVKKESTKRQKYQNVPPEKVRKEVGRYALIHGTKAAIDKYSKIYPKHKIKRTSVIHGKKNVRAIKRTLLLEDPVF